MHDATSIDNATKYTIQDLPVEINLDIPEPSKALNTWSVILMCLGGIIGVVGGLFIFFGPETIYYNRTSGMTLLQFLQAYPGPMATVGFGILAMGNILAGQATKKVSEAVDQQLAEKLAIDDSAIPEGQVIALEPISETQFMVSLKAVDAVSNAANQDGQSDGPIQK